MMSSSARNWKKTRSIQRDNSSFSKTGRSAGDVPRWPGKRKRLSVDECFQREAKERNVKRSWSYVRIWARNTMGRRGCFDLITHR